MYLDPVLFQLMEQEENHLTVLYADIVNVISTVFFLKKYKKLWFKIDGPSVLLGRRPGLIGSWFGIKL